MSRSTFLKIAGREGVGKSAFYSSIQTLGSLPEPLETPIVATENLELPNPIAQTAEAEPGTEAGAEPDEPPKPSSQQLATAFNRAQNFQRQLQEQGIYKLDGGTYAQAVPDGKGGIIMKPVDVSQLENKQEGLGATISKITANSLEVQMDTLIKKVGLNPSIFQSYAWCARRIEAWSQEKGWFASYGGETIYFWISPRYSS